MIGFLILILAYGTPIFTIIYGTIIIQQDRESNIAANDQLKSKRRLYYRNEHILAEIKQTREAREKLAKLLAIWAGKAKR